MSILRSYEETFALVAKMTIVPTFIAVASVRRGSITQINVENAFLNGDLQEEVYMVLSLGIFHQPGEVCKSRKALHSHKWAL